MSIHTTIHILHVTRLENAKEKKIINRRTCYQQETVIRE